MVRRLMIMIDEDKCTGCGLCVPSCAEGALQIVDGKAKLVSETFCDGLGACLGHCPEDALTLREVETVEFDEEAAMAHVAQMQTQTVDATSGSASSGCAGSEAFTYSAGHTEVEHDGAVPEKVAPSRLNHWPVKLRLLSPQHPIFADSHLLVVADCAGPAYAGLHEDFIKDKAAVMVCPKFEDYQANLEKLTTILRMNSVRDVTVVHMEVPCCHGLARVTQEAIQLSGKDIPLRTYILGVRGEIKAVL